MNIRKINLNLLVALDALLTERHVSRAADKIFITQPALSNALTQLRELFNDQLLVRSGKSMAPTPLALEIAPQIKQILQQIEETVTRSETFNAKTATRTFKIGMSDYGEFVLLPKLSEQLLQLAPNIRLHVINISRLDNPDLFNENKIDLGIGIFPLQAPFLNSEILFKDEATCAMSAKHATLKKLDLKNYLAAQHLAIADKDEPTLSITDNTLNQSGLKRNVALAVPHILAAMHVLAHTPLLATVPKRIALNLQKSLNLILYKPPFSVPDVTITMAWHKRFDNDAGHRWLRELIKTLVKNI